MADPFTIAMLGIAGAGAIGKMFGGGKRMNRYEDMIENYERQPLEQLHIPVDTSISEMLLENVGTQQANMVDRVSQGGARLVQSTLPAIGMMGTQASQQALMDLRRQNRENNVLEFRDAQMRRRMQENREMQDLAGMGAMYEAGRQDFWGGMGDLAQLGMYAGRMNTFGNDTTPVADPTAIGTTGTAQTMTMNPMGHTSQAMGMIDPVAEQASQEMVSGMGAPPTMNPYMYSNMYGYNFNKMPGAYYYDPNFR